MKSLKKVNNRSTPLFFACQEMRQIVGGDKGDNPCPQCGKNSGQCTCWWCDYCNRKMDFCICK